MTNAESSEDMEGQVDKEAPDFSAADFMATDKEGAKDGASSGAPETKQEEPLEDVLFHHARGYVSFKRIKDKAGKTVIKKGSKLAYKMVERLAKKETAAISKTFADTEELISSKKVIQDIDAFVESFADLRAIEKNVQCHAVVNDLGYSVNLPPEIKYYLTIMSSQFPELYRKSLFCAWFSTLLAKQQEQGKEQLKETFLVGLLHDLGLLFVPENMHKKLNGFTPTEWQYYQRHAIYSKVIIQNVWPDEEGLLRAVLLHHERGDGFGFPFAYTSEKIPPSSKLVAISDYVYELRFNNIKAPLKSMLDVLPFIKANSLRFSGDIYPIFKELAKGCNLEPTLLLRPENIAKVIEEVIERTLVLNQLFIHLFTLKHVLLNGEFPKYGKKVENICDLLQSVRDKSGMISNEYMESIHALEEEEWANAIVDVQEADILQTELIRLVDKTQSIIFMLLKFELDESDVRHGEIKLISQAIKEIVDESPASLVCQ